MDGESKEPSSNCAGAIERCVNKPAAKHRRYGRTRTAKRVAVPTTPTQVVDHNAPGSTGACRRGDLPTHAAVDEKPSAPKLRGGQATGAASASGELKHVASSVRAAEEQDDDHSQPKNKQVAGDALPETGGADSLQSQQEHQRGRQTKGMAWWAQTAD